MLDDIWGALAEPKASMTAVFVDFRFAFDTCPRDAVLTLLAEVGVPRNVLQLFFDILQKNRIVVDDVVSLLPSFDQTIRVAQGDGLSSLLFSVLWKDLLRDVYGSLICGEPRVPQRMQGRFHQENSRPS